MTGHKPTLLAPRGMPPNVQGRAETVFNLRMPGQLSLRDWLADAIQDADALLCVPGIGIDAALIAAMPARLRVIGTFSVGYEHIDVAAAQAKNIAVVHTPGVLNEATAEFAMTLLLAAARRVGEAERIVRGGRWRGWAPSDFMGLQVTGGRLGIFGMGRIGRVVARMAQGGFGMEVHYLNRTRLAPELEAGAIFHADESSFLAASKFLCLMAPSGAATRGWLNAERLAGLPRRAVVVNAARGALVDDAALAAALASGHVAAAGLDVFPSEPDVPEAYLGLENVVLTPHVASATVETRDAMGFLALEGIEAVLAGRAPPNLVR